MKVWRKTRKRRGDSPRQLEAAMEPLRGGVPFQSLRDTRPEPPTRLADGLGLESAPTRNGESAPRRPRLRTRWVPRSRKQVAGLGYTSVTIEPRRLLGQVAIECPR